MRLQELIANILLAAYIMKVGKGALKVCGLGQEWSLGAYVLQSIEPTRLKLNGWSPRTCLSLHMHCLVLYAEGDFLFTLWHFNRTKLFFYPTCWSSKKLNPILPLFPSPHHINALYYGLATVPDAIPLHISYEINERKRYQAVHTTMLN